MNAKRIDIGRRGCFYISRTKGTVMIYCPTSTSRYKRTWIISREEFWKMRKGLGYEGAVRYIAAYMDPAERERKNAVR